MHATRGATVTPPDEPTSIDGSRLDVRSLLHPSAMVTYLGTRILLLEGSLIADLQEEERQPQLTFLVASYFGALKAKHERLYPVEIALTAFSSLKFLNLSCTPTSGPSPTRATRSAMPAPVTSGRPWR
jgi:hypothetical protein